MDRNKDNHSLFKDVKEYYWYPSSKPFKVGLILTILWLSFVAFYISQGVGWGAFMRQPMDVIGSFFEGAFAPLLFLWIVVGFFLQQKDIAENAKNIAKQAQQTQLNTFLSLSKMVLQQLGVISGHIYMATQGPSAAGMETDESASLLWMQFHKDERIFIRKLLEYGSVADHQSRIQPDIYFGNDYVQRYTEDYIRAFEKLITDAEACDPDFVLRDALLTGTGQGVLYRTIMDAKSQLDMQKIEEGKQGPKLKSVS